MNKVLQNFVNYLKKHFVGYNEMWYKEEPVKKLSINDYWTTFEGKKIKFKDLSDKHIANIMYHFPFNTRINAVLQRIADKRKLTYDFLTNAPYPYKNDKGILMIWDYKKNKPIKYTKRGCK